jgi:hypothetical protein
VPVLRYIDHGGGSTLHLPDFIQRFFPEADPCQGS